MLDNWIETKPLVEFLYDACGNMTDDFNRGIQVDYIPGLNLPKTIRFQEGYIENGYFYNGVKYSKQRFDEMGNLLESETYFDNLVLRNGRPYRILHDEGYINLTELGQIEDKSYHIKDHLGNVRAVIKEDITGKPDVFQAKTYYPFGMVYTSEIMSGAFTDKTNPYLYNGKEQQDMPGGWYDYGARFYDAQLGRFHTIDKLSERYYAWSPFNYVGNNPIKRVDPFGNDWWDVVNGSVRGVTDNLLGTNTRASYNPTSASDYNGALDQADKTSLVFGAGAAVGGGYVAGGGVVAAPETLGASLVVSVVAVGVAAEGTYMAANAAKNLQKGNNYGEDKENTSKKASDSGKNEKHGDKKALSKSDQQIKDYEKKMEGATKKEKAKLKTKIKNVRETAQQNAKGEEHSRTKKR